jgi:hypothetical protein
MFRKTTPGVKDGRVQKKHRWARTRAFARPLLPWPAVNRERPGRTWRHVVSEDDVRRVAALMPDWREVSEGLHAVVLAAGSDEHLGYYCGGVVALAAWDRDLTLRWEPEFYEEHAEVLAMLDVPAERGGDEVVCRFDESSARAFALLHVFLHELGHHRDRMSTRHRRDLPRGEPFAEAWALARGRELWPAYARAFGM